MIGSTEPLLDDHDKFLLSFVLEDMRQNIPRDTIQIIQFTMVELM